MTRRSRGASLVETAIAMAIFGLAVAATMPTLAMSARLRAGAAEGRTAAQIAMATVERLSSLPYADPTAGGAALGADGSESGGPESWDDIDDARDWKGVPDGFDPSSGWSIAIRVDWVSGDAPTAPSASDQGLKRVEVRVLLGDRERTRVVLLRSALR